MSSSICKGRSAATSQTKARRASCPSRVLVSIARRIRSYVSSRPSGRLSRTVESSFRVTHRLSVSIEHWTQRNLGMHVVKFGVIHRNYSLHPVRFLTQDRVDLHLDHRIKDSQPSASVEFSGDMQCNVCRQVVRHIIHRKKWNTGETILDDWEWPAGHEKLYVSLDHVKTLEECLDIFTFVKGIYHDQRLLHEQLCSARYESSEFLSVVSGGTSPFLCIDKVVNQSSEINSTLTKSM